MKHRWATLLIFLSLAIVVGGCSAELSKSATGGADFVVSEQAVERDEGSFGARGDGEESLGGDTERMIIQTVNMSLVVEDTDKTVTNLEQIVDAYDGYIASSNRWYSDEQPYANITLRVPADSLNTVLGLLRDLAIKVESENSSGDDVTEEYFNLSADLRNAEAAEQELLVLLTEVRENRGKAEDILAIYREITNIRGQIESLKGRQQYLERMSAMSTISVTIRPKLAPKPASQQVDWDPVATITNAWQRLLSVLRVLYDIVVNVILLSPIILAPVGILVLIVQLVRRRKRRKSE